MTSPNRVGGSFPASASVLPVRPGGKLPNASQEASTTRPTRGAPPLMSIWVIAPPVSLPTSVTSARPSRSRNSPTSRAMPGSDRSALGFMTGRCAPSGRVGATHRYPGGRPAITSFHKLASSLRPALSLRRQGVEPRRPLPFAGRVHLLLPDIPAPPTMD
jgi:hypothetical protein